MQGGTPCLLSLFASKEDAMEVHGAVQWLRKAYEDYRHRVINSSISYKVFVEEFLVRLTMPIFLDEGATYSDLLQEATDRDKVKHILENRKFTEDNFCQNSFEEDDAVRMIDKYNATGTKEVASPHEKFQPFADYSEEAKERLAKVFNKHRLLCPDISSDDLISLLTTGEASCIYKIPPYSRNRDLGFVINILLSAGSLPRNWCATICKHGMLLTAAGEQMQYKNLSNTVHRFDGYKYAHLDDKLKEIQRDVFEVLKSVPSAVRNLKK